MLSRFYLHAGIPKDEGLLRRVLQAWENVVRKDKGELSKRTTAISFTQWLEKRIKETRSSNQKVSSLEEKIPEPHVPLIEELEEAKLALSKAEEEKRALQNRLGKVMQDRRKLENENALQAAAIETTNRKLEIEEESKREIQKHLRGVKEEVKRCTSKMNEAVAEASEWKKLYAKSWRNEKMVRDALAKSKEEFQVMKFELENQVESIRQDRESIIGILKEYQQALEFEQGRSEELKRNLRCLMESYGQIQAESQYWEKRFMALIGRIEDQEIVKELRDEIQLWRSKFSKLAGLANQAVKDVPKKLRRAEAEMNPFNTPANVCEFVEYCKILTEELMEKAKGAAESKKRKRKEKLKAICL